jgi:hypothetical protein
MTFSAPPKGSAAGGSSMAHPILQPLPARRGYGLNLRMPARILAAFFAFGLLQGCLVDSKHPIAEPSADAIDPDLLGSWGAMGEEGAIFVHVFQPKDSVPGAVEILAIGFETDKSGSVDRYCGHLSWIGDRRFINLVGPVEDCGKAAGEPYFFVAYERSVDNVLSVRLMKEDAVRTAIQSGKLAGEKDAGGGAAANITAEPDAIRAFILANGDSLWDPVLTLRRVEAPPK